ncbi:pyruvate, water dikinase regulatory protein [Atopobacter phocae]|uniref:pyruvate, water dikinase regulatory protein n=1 Tax=Atopobacter phocae TaxID=136492 RepID=UPI000470F755|nr:pyruvate, water dikinase regulatory protein [Atopobacter phocae]
MPNFTFVAITDTSGEIIDSLLIEVMKHYQQTDVQVIPYQFITTHKQIDRILERYQEQHVLVIHAFIKKDLRDHFKSICHSYQIRHHDLLGPLLEAIDGKVKNQKNGSPRLKHHLTDAYFDRIGAIEYTVTNDDGKNPSGLPEADIVLLGVSRTSKTPLSMVLANRNLRVANLPIMPEATVPKELYQVDPRRLIGLTTTVDVLKNYREERMRSYGLSSESPYTSIERIHEELDYAKTLYERLNCPVIINTSTRSIEESAAVILSYIDQVKLPLHAHVN